MQRGARRPSPNTQRFNDLGKQNEKKIMKQCQRRVVRPKREMASEHARRTVLEQKHEGGWKFVKIHIVHRSFEWLIELKLNIIV